MGTTRRCTWSPAAISALTLIRDKSVETKVNVIYCYLPVCIHTRMGSLNDRKPLGSRVCSQRGELVGSGVGVGHVGLDEGPAGAETIGHHANEGVLVLGPHGILSKTTENKLVVIKICTKMIKTYAVS